MEVQSRFSVDQRSSTPSVYSKRKSPRYSFEREITWDFYTSGSGPHAGFIENVSATGCLLRTREPIEHRRWIRMIVRDPGTNVHFTAVGRVIRREDRLEGWRDSTFTLHRHGVELVQPLNALIMEKLRQTNQSCSVCGTPATLHDIHEPGQAYCVLCHLRRGYQDLAAQSDP